MLAFHIIDMYVKTKFKIEFHFFLIKIEICNRTILVVSDMYI